MQFLSGSGNDYALLIGRCCLAVVFGINALSKFRREPAEIKVLANLHIPAPASPFEIEVRTRHGDLVRADVYLPREANF